MYQIYHAMYQMYHIICKIINYVLAKQNIDKCDYVIKYRILYQEKKTQKETV